MKQQHKHYEVDQSNKVEQTWKDTVLALSNDSEFTLLLRARDKRVIQEQFRLRGEPRNFILFTFSALLVFLLKNTKPTTLVTVDLEYKDSENIIHDRLINYSRLLKFDLNKVPVVFKSIGKKSPAHKLAGKVSSGKQNPDLRISLEEFLQVLFPKEKDRASRGT
ncbi:MAG: hypothetical protein M1484_01250 [Patescibacteria group bacterium]|nr:hypothetical protein [Patescibacteria group bacterium]MCL5431707.1 hypothetical protein [Patescibacteria group bacterium]